MIKGSVLQEVLMILDMYVTHSRASKYIRQKLIELQVEIDVSTTVVGDFNTPLYQKWIDPFGEQADN